MKTEAVVFWSVIVAIVAIFTFSIVAVKRSGEASKTRVFIITTPNETFEATNVSNSQGTLRGFRVDTGKEFSTTMGTANQK